MEQIETTPLVSIIINTRNRCKLLPRAIDSALEQTYKNFELIVVDGQSTDETRNVVEDYISKDNRVKYLYIEENKSAVYCLNLGFNYAYGKLISLLDDDDEYLPTKIEKQVNLFNSLDDTYGIVYCWEEFYDDKNKKTLQTFRGDKRGDVYFDILTKPCTGASTSLMIRKSVIENIGGFDDTIRFGTDYQFNLNASKYFKFDYIPEVLVIRHYNHIYVHLTTQVRNLNLQEPAIELYEKILQVHNEAFQKNHNTLIWIYSSIMNHSIHSKNYKKLKSYFSKSLKLKISFKNKIILLYKVLKRFILFNIFNK